MVRLTLPLLTERWNASCQVVIHQSSQMMVSACCRISGLAAVTRQPQWGIAWNSVFPVSEAITLFAQQPTVLLSIIALSYRFIWCSWMFLILFQQQELLSQSFFCTTHWLTTLWGAAAVVLSEIIRASYINSRNFKSVSTKISHA